MRLFTILALALAIGLGTALSPFASSSPDGLEKVAQRKAAAATAKNNRRQKPLTQAAAAQQATVPAALASQASR